MALRFRFGRLWRINPQQFPAQVGLDIQASGLGSLTDFHV
jgi:hypothetical protein